MQQPLQVTFHGISPSAAVEERIRSEVDGLERLFDQITSCRVTVEAPHQNKNKGNLYSVRIDMHLPDRELVVGKERQEDHANEDVYVAIKHAFKAAARQLEDYAEDRHRKVKRHDERTFATISKLFAGEGYGFVAMPEGGEVYFHQNSVKKGGFSKLQLGDKVRVIVDEEGEQGPHASAIYPAG